MNAHWMIPDWPAPPSVKAVFTTRHGGLSPAPFDSAAAAHQGLTLFFVMCVLVLRCVEIDGCVWNGARVVVHVGNFLVL